MRTILLDLAAEPDVVSALRIAEELRRAAALATPEDARWMVGAVDDADPLVSIGALHALATVASLDVDRVLIDALHDVRPWMREHAAWALAARRPQRAAVTELLALHGSGSDLTAMVAQRTLAGWASSDPIGINRAIVGRLRSNDDPVVRRRLVDTLGQVDTGVAREHLVRVALDRDEDLDVRIAACNALRGDADGHVRAALLTLADESSPIATEALLALVDVGPGACGRDERPGFRVGQLTLTGELDGRLSHAGAGDTGGIASLLCSVSHVLAGRDEVGSVLTLSRSSPDGELASLLLPGEGGEAFGAVSFGPNGQPPALASEWDFRLRIERGIERALARRPPLHVLHLRMADVGTLAAASVARRRGIPVVFTCAPDPHGPIAQRQAAGSLTRDDFGAVDVVEHLWFRARMVERLVEQADHLVLFPRPDVASFISRVMGVDPELLDRRSTVAAEGIDLARIDGAAADPASTVVDELAGRLPSERRGRPLVVSVGRLHPVKGMTRVVRDWLSSAQLTTATNLVIVGGDLDRPNPSERRIVDEVAALVDGHPAGAGVVMLGAREPTVIAELLTAAARGSGTAVAPGGVYVNGAAKEEFGLAVLEALAAGLPVVAPREGGPSTYVHADVTGVLVGAEEDLAPAMVRALALHSVPGRAAAARAMVADRYTIDAYADALLVAYDAAAAAPV